MFNSRSIPELWNSTYPTRNLHLLPASHNSQKNKKKLVSNEAGLEASAFRALYLIQKNLQTWPGCYNIIRPAKKPQIEAKKAQKRETPKKQKKSYSGTTCLGFNGHPQTENFSFARDE
jgi:hypothetical protein